MSIKLKANIPILFFWKKPIAIDFDVINYKTIDLNLLRGTITDVILELKTYDVEEVKINKK